MSRGGFSTADFLRMTAPITAVPLTMACWAKNSTLGKHYLMGLKNSASGTDRNQFSMYLGGGSTLSSNEADGAGVTGLNAGIPSTSNWYHACAAWSSTTATIWIDGAGKTTVGTTKVPSGINRFSIGIEDGSSPLFPSLGLIAHAALWSAVLTDQEVALLATGLPPYKVRMANLIGYWPLHGAQSPEPDFISPNSFPLVGAPAVGATAPNITVKKRFRS